MKTLHNIYLEVKRRLELASIEEADQDARLLIIEAFNLSPIFFALESNKILEGVDFDLLEEMVTKRCKRVPISQIFGEKEFWSLTFKVTGDTLTPRPDSETLIEAALNHIDDKTKAIDILDLGTGTGCLLLSLLNELPKAFGVGIDISSKALEVAIENAKNLQLEDRAVFKKSNWFSSFKNFEKFDIIISNPPYIGLCERDTLAPEVKDHEPQAALFSGEDGLDDYHIIAQNCSSFLKPQGMVILEIGYQQAQAVNKIFISEGFNSASLFKDLGGRDRCLIFRK